MLKSRGSFKPSGPFNSVCGWERMLKVKLAHLRSVGGLHYQFDSIASLSSLFFLLETLRILYSETIKYKGRRLMDVWKIFWTYINSSAIDKGWSITSLEFKCTKRAYPFFLPFSISQSNGLGFCLLALSNHYKSTYAIWNMMWLKRYKELE